MSLRPFPCLILLAGEMDEQQQRSCLQYWQWHLQSLNLHSVLIRLEEMFTRGWDEGEALGKRNQHKYYHYICFNY